MSCHPVQSLTYLSSRFLSWQKFSGLIQQSFDFSRNFFFSLLDIKLHI